MAKPIHPEATHHCHSSSRPRGETDILMNVMIVFSRLDRVHSPAPGARPCAADLGVLWALKAAQ